MRLLCPPAAAPDRTTRASFRLLPRMPPRTDSTRVFDFQELPFGSLTCTVRSCVFDRSNRSNGSRKGFLLERQCVRTHSAISCCDVRLNHFHGIDYAVKLLCHRKTQLQSGFFELQVVVQQASVALRLGLGACFGCPPGAANLLASSPTSVHGIRRGELLWPYHVGCKTGERE